ncbi:MAG TPA: DUF6728 family protein [Parafilimonas sp.]|nr:DUF6728 family protein [Parafilimonas sp.]
MTNANITFGFTMGIWRKIQEYLFIKKRDPNSVLNTNIKLMNGMNRISLFMFLIALVILLIRYVIIPLFR